MNKYLSKLWEISQKPKRLIVGLMSGTSLDGLDLALCELHGHGKETQIRVTEFSTMEYNPSLRDRLYSIQSKEQTQTLELTRLHTELGIWYGETVLDHLSQWGIASESVDLIASHGQTVYHAPANDKGEVSSTFQIVDGDHIAQKSGIITVSDFRQKHTAAGGDGAPLAGIFDERMFRDQDMDRMLLNLGGIANFTWLPSRNSNEQILTSDTGPANTLINEAMQKYFGRPYDKDGEVAATGDVHTEMVRYVLLEPYFRRSFPKTTGQEDFQLKFIENLMEGHGIELSNEDLIASLTAITSQSISRAFDEITDDREFECYVSGGGVHNRTLMDDLEQRNERAIFRELKELGLSADAKEAAMMAFFANELVAGEGCAIPGITDHPMHFGKISLPS